MSTVTYSQPIHRSNEGFFNTQSGNLIDLLNPTPEMISIGDIVQALSNTCRFGGHLPQHYSVAEHTLLVWLLAPNALKPAALLHDAPEAYLGDVIKPLKVLLGDAYKKLEDNFTDVIFNKYGVSTLDLVAIKEYDLMAVELEHNYFRLGKQDLIKYQYEYRTELGWYEKPHNMLLQLYNHYFLQKEISFNSINQ
jgi:hypothetical protein